MPKVAEAGTSFRDRIAAAAPPRKRELTTLGGVEVEVREMRAGEKNALTDHAASSAGGGRVRVSMAKYYPAIIIASVVEPGTDTPVFQHTTADLEVIAALDAEEAERVVAIAHRLSGMDQGSAKVIMGNSETASDG